MTSNSSLEGCPSGQSSRADAAWRRLRQAIAEEIVGKLPHVLEVEEIPIRLSIPRAEVQRGLDDGSIVTTKISGKLHMVCGASREFLQAQTRIRLPLPETLRPIGA